MDCRNINIFEIGFDNVRAKPQSYIFLDKIPPSEYQEMVYTIKNEDISLDNFTVVLTDESGSNLLRVSSSRGRGRGFFGLLELELRGALVDYDGKVLTLNENCLPICHCVLDDFAVSILETSLMDKITIDDVEDYLQEEHDIKVVLKGIPDKNDGLFPEVTKYFTQKKDVDKFYSEIEDENRVRNIILDAVKMEDMLYDVENSDILE